MNNEINLVKVVTALLTLGIFVLIIGVQLEKLIPLLGLQIINPDIPLFRSLISMSGIILIAKSLVIPIEQSSLFKLLAKCQNECQNFTTCKDHYCIHGEKCEKNKPY